MLIYVGASNEATVGLMTGLLLRASGVCSISAGCGFVGLPQTETLTNRRLARTPCPSTL